MKKEYILIAIACMVIVCMFTGLVYWGITEESKAIAKIRYQVFQSAESDGVLCKDYLWSRAGYRFADCEDGKVYINPETYRKVTLK